MTPHDALIRRAHDAFADDARRMPAITLRGGCDIDRYDPPAPFDPGTDATTDAYIERFAFWGLVHLDAASWRHYLPSLIAYALTHPEDPAMAAEALVHSLCPPDRFPPRLGSLDAAQDAVVRELLELLVLASGNESLQQLASRSLDEWWGPAPRARPTRDALTRLRAAPVTYRRVHEPEYQSDVPETLAASGRRDLPGESRRVQTWGGYLCGDVPATIAVNVLRRPAHAFDTAVTTYAGFFGIDAPTVPVSVAGSARAVRLEGRTPIVSSAGVERVQMVVAEAADIVAFTMRAPARDDVDAVMRRVAASFALATLLDSR
jgi:hypothetical protein